MVEKVKGERKRLDLEKFLTIGKHYFLQNEIHSQKGMIDIIIDLIGRHVAVTMAVSIFGNFCEFICKF